MRRYDSRCFSLHDRMAELEAFSSIDSVTGQKTGSRMPGSCHTPTISWSGLDVNHLGPSSPTSKPLQILPTHLSIPDAYTLQQCTLQSSPEPSAEHDNVHLSIPDAYTLQQCTLQSSPEPSAEHDNVVSEVVSSGLDSSLLNGSKACTTVDMDPGEACPADTADADNAAVAQVQSFMVSAGEHDGDDLGGSVVVDDDTDITYQDSVIVHSDSSVPGAEVGQALGEGQEGAGVSSHEPGRTSGVSFNLEPARNLHRHKSTNYSRLLDFRLDEWYVLLKRPVFFLLRSWCTARSLRHCTWCSVCI
jgi:hypothetical protein